jgi:hypothetical protein
MHQADAQHPQHVKEAITRMRIVSFKYFLSLFDKPSLMPLGA